MTRKFNKSLYFVVFWLWFFPSSAEQVSLDEALKQTDVLTLSIRFNGINNDEYLKFREYLLAYSGFEKMALLQKSASRVVLSYQSKAPIALIENNLRETSKALGLQVYIDSKAASINIQVIGRTKSNILRLGEW